MTARLTILRPLLLGLLVATLTSGCTTLKRLAYEGPGRDGWQQPDKVIAALGLEVGATVADIGSGGGYFTFRLAQAVGPLGRVYAVDVDDDLLEYIAVQARRRGQSQVEAIQALPDDPKLPAGAVDLVFTSNTYHHLKDRPHYFARVRSALKPGGRVAIIDYRPRGWFGGGHTSSPDQIIQEMRNAGYRLQQQHDFLERQAFLVFAPEPG